MWFSFLLFVPVLLAQSKLEMRGDCSLPLDRGTSCAAKNESIRWHMDPATLTCLAFLHEGCGGNGNSFETKGDCSQNCLPADFLSCPANSDPVAREDGTSHCGDAPFQPQCPEGAECRKGFMVGVCCDAKIGAKYTANHKPDCGPAKKAVKSEQFGFDLIHLGKSCDSKHCPSDSECHQGAFFAYCCR